MLRLRPKREVNTMGEDHRPPMISSTKMNVESLDAWYGAKQALFSIDLPIKSNQVTAMIGPSGCGKSTLIRCLNRMHELVPGTRVSGRVLLDDSNVYSKGIDPATVRRK